MTLLIACDLYVSEAPPPAPASLRISLHDCLVIYVCTFLLSYRDKIAFAVSPRLIPLRHPQVHCRNFRIEICKAYGTDSDIIVYELSED
jgi:hypothetical protein